MLEKTDIIDGWSVRAREDRRFGVFDKAGKLLAGPFAAREQAMLAALELPRPVRALPDDTLRPDGFTSKG